MKEEKENRACALEFNNLLFDLSENGHSDNAIANGIIFSLCVHILNSKFKINEICIQIKKLYYEIKSELGRIDIEDDITKKEPINPQWD
jgi:hypothetical protein